VQEITFVDVTPPVVVCPAATTVAADGNCQALIPDVLPGVIATDSCGALTLSQDPPAGTVVGLGTHLIAVTATDEAGNQGSCTTTLAVVDGTPPVVALNGGPQMTVECHTTFADPGAGASDNCAGTLPVTVTGAVDANSVGIYQLTYTATDPSGNVGTATRTVEVVDTTPPMVGPIAAPVDPVLVNTLVNASATFTENCGLETAVWDWGDGVTSSGAVDGTAMVGSHTYTAAGVYTVTLTLTDGVGLSGQSVYRYIVVYDPAGGFVTGGGWINSPPEAYTPDPSLTGKATFGFVSKYQKGATVPTGNTQFNFHTAKMDFQSTSYQWLVIAGARAQYKGFGQINGAGNYGFLLTAIDGQVSGGGGVDKFRIKIWDVGTDALVYDNQMGAEEEADPTTVVGGGSIVVHKEK
jgi:PKD repeat protein